MGVFSFPDASVVYLKTCSTPSNANTALPRTILVPVPDLPIHARRDELARLLRVPRDASDGLVARLELVVHLARLPVPEGDVAGRVAAGEELAIWADSQVDGRARVVVAPVRFLPVLPELFVRTVHHYLIV